jgi:hypothetical protein
MRPKKFMESWNKLLLAKTLIGWHRRVSVRENTGSAENPRFAIFRAKDALIFAAVKGQLDTGLFIRDVLRPRFSDAFRMRFFLE